MRVVLQHGGSYLTTDLQAFIGRLALVALHSLGQFPSSSGSKNLVGDNLLRARLRESVFSTLVLLPLTLLEPSFATILPAIVAEFTLSESSATLVTSYLEAGNIYIYIYLFTRRMLWCYYSTLHRHF